MRTPVGERLEKIREDIAAACSRAGRAPGEVTLVAVSKRQPVQAIMEALAAGQVDLGESYAQELRDKAREFDGPSGSRDASPESPDGSLGSRDASPVLRDASPVLRDVSPVLRDASPVSGPEPGSGAAPRWHFIGPLQRNKVKYVVGTASLLHAVDSPRLFSALQERAAALGIIQDILLQVNLAGEAQKAGVRREEVAPLLASMGTMANLRCLGLMLMPPWDPDPEAARPLFLALRQMRDALVSTPMPNVDLVHLSMGMSHDFGVAIEEGATLVRVGTAIFGAR